MKIVINSTVIKSLSPCVDRHNNYLRFYRDFSGSLSEFFVLPEISHRDKLWVSLRLLPRETVEIFAIDCAVQAQQYAAAAYAADAAYAAAYAAAYDAYDAADADAAAYAAAADAAYAADAADAADAAADADYAAAADAERDRQLDAIIYLTNGKF